MKLRKSDQVIITKGKDKGKKGKIEKLFPKENRILLPGLNMFKRHSKRKDERTPGGIIDFARSLPVSNVALVCPSCKKPTRVGYLLANGEKTRICRKCKKTL